MPYKIEKVKGGWQVVSPDHPGGFKKTPHKTKEEAIDQLAAIKTSGESTISMIGSLLSEADQHNEKAWWGIDFDGTLSTYDEWRGPSHIGDPIEKTIDFVKSLLKSGERIKIFTARVSNPDEEDEAREAIRGFCKEHFGRTFPITNEKDPNMIGLVDDKLDMRRVKQNTGEFL
jgi:hypothetical protein